MPAARFVPWGEYPLKSEENLAHFRLIWSTVEVYGPEFDSLYRARNSSARLYLDSGRGSRCSPIITSAFDSPPVCHAKVPLGMGVHRYVQPHIVYAGAPKTPDLMGAFVVRMGRTPACTLETFWLGYATGSCHCLAPTYGEPRGAHEFIYGLF